MSEPRKPQDVPTSDLNEEAVLKRIFAAMLITDAYREQQVARLEQRIAELEKKA